MADVCITEYTDPGCPWAYSAEPFRRRLTWLYGDRLTWELRMGVLAEAPEEYLERDFTPERQARAFAHIARDHGMPIDTRVRPRMAATAPACRAVGGARVRPREPERAPAGAARRRRGGGAAARPRAGAAAAGAHAHPQLLRRAARRPRHARRRGG